MFLRICRLSFNVKYQLNKTLYCFQHSHVGYLKKCMKRFKIKICFQSFKSFGLIILFTSKVDEIFHAEGS